MEAKLHKTYPEDPDRCQGICTNGQCANKAAELSKFCLMHGGNKAAEAQDKKLLRNYRLTKFQARLDEKVEADSLKSLRDEIGILRILMEETINRCENQVDIVLAAGSIGDLAIKIEKLVSSCSKLDKQLGQYLDKSQLTQIMMEIVAIIGEYITDSETLIKISKKLGALVTRSGEEES